MKQKCVDEAAPFSIPEMEDDELRISPPYLVQCNKEMLNVFHFYLFNIKKRNEKEDASLSYPVLSLEL